MVKNVALVLLGAALATVLILGSGQDTEVPEFVEMPLEEEGRDRRVTDEELEVYIDVYRAMQSDHGLNIEEVLAPRSITLAEFRDLERRVQNDSGKVERVREALLKHVQDNSRFGEPARMPAAGDAKGDKAE